MSYGIKNEKCSRSVHCAGRLLFHSCGIRTLFIYCTNHVGEQRNFCFAEIRRPACVCSTNSTLSAQRLARNCPLFFIRDKFKPNRFDIGLSRAPAPTPKFYRHKIAVALCGLYLGIRGHKKRCRVSTPTPLCLYLYFIFLYKVHILYHGNISLPPPAKTNILSRFPRTSFHAFSSLQRSYRTTRW